VKEPVTAQSEEDTISSLRVRHVGALVTLGNVVTTVGKDDGATYGPACTLSGNRLGRAALRREQGERFETNFREPMGRKANPITDVTITALGKEELELRL
jgi:hypothetical protein